MTGSVRNEYIKRLKERLREKPESRLFLSLAEELKKDDKLIEAMDVLINGLKKVPDFDAARLALGRWYIESNMLSEAEKEFSEVLKHSPDNIFAVKWLNEINNQFGTQLSGQEDALDKAQDISPEPYAQLLKAERLIEASQYQAAMEIYDAILMSNPKDMPKYKTVLQKRQELISLISIIGKNKNYALSRLTTFLNAIRVRFKEKPATIDKNSAISRLNKFLEAVQARFRASFA